MPKSGGPSTHWQSLRVLYGSSRVAPSSRLRAGRANWLSPESVRLRHKPSDWIGGRLRAGPCSGKSWRLARKRNLDASAENYPVVAVLAAPSDFSRHRGLILAPTVIATSRGVRYLRSRCALDSIWWTGSLRCLSHLSFECGWAHPTRGRMPTLLFNEHFDVVASSPVRGTRQEHVLAAVLSNLQTVTEHREASHFL